MKKIVISIMVVFVIVFTLFLFSDLQCKSKGDKISNVNTAANGGNMEKYLPVGAKVIENIGNGWYTIRFRNIIYLGILRYNEGVKGMHLVYHTHN